MRRMVCAALVAAWVAGSAPAAVVVVGNATGQEVQFVVLPHPDATPEPAALKPGESRAFPVGREALVAFSRGDNTDRFRIEPYTAYVFAEQDKQVTFQGVELAGNMPRPDDVPAKPPPAKPLTLAVKLLVDDVDPRTQAVWEKSLRQRVGEASKVLDRLCGVRLEVTAAGDWKSDPAAGTLKALLTDFERKVRPAPARLAVGFTSRKIDTEKDGNVGGTRGPMHSHVLVREGHPRTEPERVEVLVHELCHVLGAAHSPDPLSVVRPKLGDGLAANARYHISLDPLNLLAVSIWVEELRGGKLGGWADLSPKARERLRVVYRTLREALPDDPVAGEYVAVLDRLLGIAADVPVNPADPPSPTLSPKQEGIRSVVRAVAARAREVAGRNPRPRGDELTAEYVRAAAAAAAQVDEEWRATAFLTGLGVSLDDSTILRDNPLMRELCRAVESDAERKDRLAALGVPTVRHRRDLCQHFAVSAALAAEFGPSAAEAAGLAKEMIDLRGASGFSFSDLAADYAGVAFAERVKKDPARLKRLAAEFRVEDNVPPVEGLRDGLSPKRFEAEYGTVTDPRFKKAVEEIRKRVADLAK